MLLEEKRVGRQGIGEDGFGSLDGLRVLCGL